MRAYAVTLAIACVVASPAVAQADTLAEAEKACGVEGPKPEPQNLYCRAQTWPKDRRDLLRRSAEEGYAPAQLEYGMLLKSKASTTEEFDKARTWVLKAAEQGLADAQNNYAFDYFYGRGGAPKDRRLAIPWLRRAAEQGYAHSQTLMAEAYYQGDGTERNTAEAVRLYTAAADAGHPFATYMLGRLHLSGRVAPKDEAKAFALMLRSATAGVSYAQEDVSRLYREGRGTERSASSALLWLLIAGESDSELKDTDQIADLAAEVGAAETARVRREAKSFRALEWTPE